jgi:ABC-type nickel/cobalt efflux system permease component RcnA
MSGVLLLRLMIILLLLGVLIWLGWRAWQDARQQIARLPTTRLAVEAIIDIAQHHKARWLRVSASLGERFSGSTASRGRRGRSEGQAKKRFAHRLSCYQVTPEALPIIIYASGAGGRHLPQDDEAIRLLRTLMRVARQVCYRRVRKKAVLNR